MDNTLDQLQALCGQLGIPVPPAPSPEPPAPEPVAAPAPEVYRPAEGVECWCPCDFRQLPVEPGSVKLVATDIPYDPPWQRNIPELGRWCAEKLTDDGLMVTFYAVAHIGKLLDLLGEHLVFQWLLLSPVYGVPRSRDEFIHRYQLAAVFSKSKGWHPRQLVADIIPAGWRNNDSDHPHRKNISQMQYIVEAFSDENDLVCDPCAGSWTTGIACQMMCRRFIGSEKDAQWMATAKEKFGKLLPT